MSNVSTFNKALAKVTAQLQSVIRDTPQLIASLAVRHYRDSFKNAGFTDDALSRWQPLKNPRSGSSPLIRTGALRGSIRAINISPTRVTIGTDKQYAQYHQYGKGVVQRQFIGKSSKLNQQIKNEILRLAEKRIK